MGGSARVVVTTRDGGVSCAPYDSFNLASHVGDDPLAVAENRRRLASSLGADRVVFMDQVHGARVGVVGPDSPDTVAGVDALVTTTAGLAVAVLVADCVPVVLVGSHAVAVVHAGRNGVRDGVVGAAVRVLRDADGTAITATIGPAVCGGCYEVPQQLQDEVATVVPQTRVTTRWGTPGLDLTAGVCAQLDRAGVTAREVAGVCTREDPAYFSHRRDGVTGRFAVVALLET